MEKKTEVSREWSLDIKVRNLWRLKIFLNMNVFQNQIETKQYPEKISESIK